MMTVLVLLSICMNVLLFLELSITKKHLMILQEEQFKFNDHVIVMARQLYEVKNRV